MNATFDKYAGECQEAMLAQQEAEKEFNKIQEDFKASAPNSEERNNLKAQLIEQNKVVTQLQKKAKVAEQKMLMALNEVGIGEEDDF